MTALETLVHEAFVAWSTRHRAELDRWEVVEKAAIASLADFHRRGIGQVVRQARVRLFAKSEFWPAEGDPDFRAIVQMKRNLEMRTALDTMRTVRVRRYEERVRAVLDIPYIPDWSLP